MVTKSSGELEPYDRTKVVNSMMKALIKRPFDPDKLEDVINTLENEWAQNKQAITSKRIGRDILRKLRDFDEVAFVRYASIYHNHDNVRGFVNLSRMNSDKSYSMISPSSIITVIPLQTAKLEAPNISIEIIHIIE